VTNQPSACRASRSRGCDAALAAGSAALTGALWTQLLRGLVPGGAARWERVNHAGEPVTLLEGAALVGGTIAGAMVCGPATGVPGHRVAAVCTTALGAAAIGALDDLRQSADRKGLAGHLGALRRGQVTTGSLKILVLGASGIAGVALLDRSSAGLLDTALGAAVVAGSANLANLLDLRPGRALKAAGLALLPLLLTGPRSPVAAVAGGAAAALLPADLRGTSMLGDTGANPLGGLVGLALVDRQGRVGRVATVVVITGLTLASEQVSFTRVIESTPVLREFDALGRPRR